MSCIWSLYEIRIGLFPSYFDFHATLVIVVISQYQGELDITESYCYFFNFILYLYENICSGKWIRPRRPRMMETQHR
jgi:hypothetical protein